MEGNKKTKKPSIGTRHLFLIEIKLQEKVLEPDLSVQGTEITLLSVFFIYFFLAKTNMALSCCKNLFTCARLVKKMLNKNSWPTGEFVCQILLGGKNKKLTDV